MKIMKNQKKKRKESNQSRDTKHAFTARGATCLVTMVKYIMSTRMKFSILERPCKRCVDRGIANMCHDAVKKKRGRKIKYLDPEEEEEIETKSEVSPSLPISFNPTTPIIPTSSLESDPKSQFDPELLLNFPSDFFDYFGHLNDFSQNVDNG